MTDEADLALTTARLRLRLPRAGDGAFLVRLMNDPDWLRHIGDRGVRSAEAAAAYVEQRMLPSFRDHAFGMFVVETLAGGEPVGICGLVKRPSLAECDLGFAFLPEQRGRGYAVEAGRAVLADAGERLRVRRVLAITTPDNHASARVLERLGMARAGERTLDGGPPLRLYEWSAPAPTWPKGVQEVVHGHEPHGLLAEDHDHAGRGRAGIVIRLARGPVVVREWREDDAEALAVQANDPRVARNLRDAFPHPYGLAHAHRFLAVARSCVPPRLFAIEADGQVAGGIGFVPKTDVERVGAEVGYWLGPSYWGRGLCTAALQALTDHAFGAHPELRRLFALPYATNAASARVLEKAGYTREGTLRQSAIKEGRVVDQWMYAIVRDQWAARP